MNIALQKTASCGPTCADPESFARGGSTLTTFFLVDEGRTENPYYTKS